MGECQMSSAFNIISCPSKRFTWIMAYSYIRLFRALRLGLS